MMNGLKLPETTIDKDSFNKYFLEGLNTSINTGISTDPEELKSRE